MAKSKTQQVAAKKADKKATKVAEPTKKTKPAKKVESESEADSSDDDESSAASDDDEEEEEEEDASSDEASESEEEAESSDEEMEEAEDDVKVAGAKRERDSDAESSDAAEDDEEEEEEAPAPKKSKVTISREQPQQFGAEGLSLFIGQLDFSANDQDLKTFLEKQGIEVKNVRMSKHRHIEGNNRGFAHVDVEDEENKNKVLALNGKEFMDRKLRIDDGTAATQRKTDTNFSSKSKTVFVANLSRDIDEDGFKEAFESFGTIVSVRLPIDRETNNIKGFGYVEFESEEIAEKAVKEMSGVRINNRPIRTDFAGSVDGDRATHRGDRGRGGFRGGRGGGRGDFRGGRGGGRGRGGFGGDRGRGGFRGGRGRGGY